MSGTCTTRFIAAEARALLARLAQVRPLSLTMTMVPAAAVSLPAMRAVDAHLGLRRRALRRDLTSFLRWLAEAARTGVAPARMQQQFVGMRMRVLAELTQLDIFADAVTQRSEQRHGVSLAGLDALADDAMRVPHLHGARPSVICYLDRGYGAAIRRAATRLPGGGHSPIAIIRVPRERMVGSGVASSIVHEVGHQVAAMHELVPTVKQHLNDLVSAQPTSIASGLRWWQLWLSELVPDWWAVARLGTVATRGLIGVVSLPKARVFHIRTDDPHPPPWLRVFASCAFGQALHPHRSWADLARVWTDLYPLAAASTEAQRTLRHVLRTLPTLVEAVLTTRPAAFEGMTIRQVLRDPTRRPDALAATFADWRKHPHRIRTATPTLALAVLGHAAQTGAIPRADEGGLVAALLQRWAVDRADGIDRDAPCPQRHRDRLAAIASAGVTTTSPISA